MSDTSSNDTPETPLPPTPIFELGRQSLVSCASVETEIGEPTQKRKKLRQRLWQIVSCVFYILVKVFCASQAEIVEEAWEGYHVTYV